MQKIKFNPTFSKSAFRFLSVLFYSKIIPAIKYFFYFFLILFFISVCYLVLFDKIKLDNAKDIIFRKIYTLTNSNISNLKIKVTGNKYTEYNDILSPVREVISKDKFNHKIIIELIKDKIEDLPWVKEVVISINFREDINIKIVEYTPFAIWNNNENKSFIVSKEGVLIDDKDYDYDDLIILNGNEAYKNISSLFNILSINPEIGSDIYSASWVGKRRWDIRFKNGVLVKLPEENIGDAWEDIKEIYNIPGAMIGLKSIDLRISNKIYLEYEDNIVREIKSL